ncbi:STAS domain-containing protein [candidate division KSB1 bacterium]|nr:STAS domain-containing protein [candidate division KSB1 bacterium]
MLRPKLLTTLQDYSREQFRQDVAAGIIVGVVALPLCIAFAIASGLSPERGLLTGIVAGLLISALGGSRVQIGGPAGAFIVIVYGIVQQYGIEGLITATLMAGIVLVVMGLVGLGSVIKFIPQPVVTGFTSGIAVVIFSSQFPDALGLTLPDLPAEFAGKWLAIIPAIPDVSPEAFAISLGTILLLVNWSNWKRISQRIPGPFVALIAGTVLTQLLGLNVETIGTRFGEIPSVFPALVFPDLSPDVLRGLIQPAMVIAILVAIESLLSAVVADGAIGGRHRSNMELVAQGTANFASALFGGMPATGAIARTMTNIKNGGRTPIAGIVHALTLLVITVFAAKWASLIPLACLAGILVVVAYHMFEWHSFVATLRSPKGDVAVMLITFGLTVVVDLTVAIEVGMVMAAFLFMKRMSQVTNVAVIRRELTDQPDIELGAKGYQIPPGVDVYEINGPFFFGAVYKFKEAINVVGKHPRVRILRMAQANAIDATGLRALEEVWHDCLKHGSTFLISEIHAQPFVALMKSPVFEKIGEENVLASFEEALARARILLAEDGAVAPAKRVDY